MSTSDLLIATSAPSYGRTPRQLLRDPSVSCRSKALYALLDDYADTEGRAFPSRSTLAESLGCSVDSIDRAVAELERLGWLRRVVRRRENRTYRATLYVLEWSPKASEGSRTGAATWPHGCGEGSRTGAARVAAPVPTEEEPLEEEPLEDMLTAAAASESVAARPSLSKPERDGLFDQFWKNYPRRAGKGAARKVFDRLLSKAGVDAPVLADAIVDGAARMGEDPNLPEKQFVPYPATWLNRDGWEDEPYPARSSATAVYVEQSSAREAFGW